MPLRFVGARDLLALRGKPYRPDRRIFPSPGRHKRLSTDMVNCRSQSSATPRTSFRRLFRGNCGPAEIRASACATAQAGCAIAQGRRAIAHVWIRSVKPAIPQPPKRAPPQCADATRKQRCRRRTPKTRSDLHRRSTSPLPATWQKLTVGRTPQPIHPAKRESLPRRYPPTAPTKRRCGFSLRKHTGAAHGTTDLALISFLAPALPLQTRPLLGGPDSICPKDLEEAATTPPLRAAPIGRASPLVRGYDRRPSLISRYIPRANRPLAVARPPARGLTIRAALHFGCDCPS